MATRVGVSRSTVSRALAAALFVLPALIFAFAPRGQRVDLEAPADEQLKGFRCTG